MLGKAYESAGRLAHKTISPLLKLYVNSNHMRVRTLILNEQNQVLLVRSWLGHQKWTLPGGGVRWIETPAEAAAREVYEETGLRVAADHLKELGTFINADNNAPFTILCFTIEVVKREPKIARRHRLEMLETAWFPRNMLPENTSKTVINALDLWANTKK